MKAAAPFADQGDQWRSEYDMPSNEFKRSAMKVWEDVRLYYQCKVRPLYAELHCYVRSKLKAFYKGRGFEDDGLMPGKKNLIQHQPIS